jgi:hypothetical protein
MMNFDFSGAVERLDRDGLSLDSLASGLKTVYRYGSPPVTIEQFLSDDYYMGKSAKNLYPDNLPDLLDVFHPKNNYIEVILTGGVGIGKSYMTALAMSYIIYTMGCYSEPHRWIGASPSSPIVLINMSINALKAREVIFNRIKLMVDSSPYFKEKFLRDMRLMDSLVWHTSMDKADVKNRTGAQIMLKPGTGDSLSALGDDIYAGIGDELNFFRVIEKSKRSYGESFDPAQRLYDVVSRRMKSRFTSGGLPLGKFFLLSSAQYPDDFIERRIIEAETDGSLGKTVKVIRKSLWEAKRGVFLGGKAVYGSKTFRVETGSSRRGSRLLDTYNDRTGTVEDRGLTDIEGEVIYPPVELYPDFFRDIEGSVRDFGGKVTRAISPFFQDTEVIYKAKDDLLVHPWSVEETTLQDGSDLLYDALFAYDEKEKRYRLKKSPEKLRYAHVDLAESGDSAGVSIVHLCGWKSVMRNGVEYQEPVFEVDMTLRVNPPHGGEIQFSSIRAIFYRLRDYGMAFGLITYDSFQSTDSVQELSKRGFYVDKLSVDRDMGPYSRLRDSFYDGRIRIYFYSKLFQELQQLEKRGEKVDHPAAGSKDVSDSLAGAVWNCYLDSATLSESELHGMLPQGSGHMSPMSKKQSTIDMVRNAEEEMRDFMGGNRKIR